MSRTKKEPPTTPSSGGTQQPELLTVVEAATLLKVRPHSLYNGQLRHQLPFLRVGKQLRIDVADLRRWLDQQHEARPAA